MHVDLWDAKGSELCMRPLIEELRDKGIPLTRKAFGISTRGWLDLRLLVAKFAAPIVANGPQD